MPDLRQPALFLCKAASKLGQIGRRFPVPILIPPEIESPTGEGRGVPMNLVKVIEEKDGALRVRPDPALRGPSLLQIFKVGHWAHS
jgi:hypothetical protein